MPTDNAYLLALEVEMEAVRRRHMVTYQAAAQAAVARAFRVVATTEGQGAWREGITPSACAAEAASGVPFGRDDCSPCDAATIGGAGATRSDDT